MTQDTHTAEKWSIANIHAAGLYDNDGSIKIVVYGDGDTKHIASIAAQVAFKRGSGSDLDDPARDAHARLIAASPDLLAFAKAHDAYMLDAGYSGPESDALHPKAAENWRQCRAAISLATGGERG